MTVAYKQRLTARDAAVQVAALPFVKIPTAKHALGNGKWEGGAVDSDRLLALQVAAQHRR